APAPAIRAAQAYTAWLQSMQLQGDGATLARIIARILLQVLVNCAMTAAAFVAAIYLVGVAERSFALPDMDETTQKSIVFGGALLISLPFLIAAYRKLKALALLLAEMVMAQQVPLIQRAFAEIIPLVSIALIMLLIGSFSRSILPPMVVLLSLLLAAALVTLALWRPFVRLHTRLQVALFDTLNEKADEKA
ncbi:MAG TPA: cation/H(+) antiporter, partial [Oxalicibacterium sp.]|nr:cation/H(+) antiporter [Oxalicibacterium sp.]